MLKRNPLVWIGLVLASLFTLAFLTPTWVPEVLRILRGEPRWQDLTPTEKAQRLAARLDDLDDSRRDVAPLLLGELGRDAEPAIPALIRALKSRKPLTRPYTGGSLTFGDQVPKDAREALTCIFGDL